MYEFQQCIIYLKTRTPEARISMYILMYKKMWLAVVFSRIRRNEKRGRSLYFQ
jgi:hypothetical protein